MRSKLQIYKDAGFWKDYSKAADPSTDEVALLRLSAHNSAAVRRQVAGNRATPNYILESLLHDKSSQVRAGVALRTNLPEVFFWFLSKDNSDAVRLSLLLNVSIPGTVVEALTLDQYRDISDVAREQLDCIQRLVNAGKAA